MATLLQSKFEVNKYIKEPILDSSWIYGGMRFVSDSYKNLPTDASVVRPGSIGIVNEGNESNTEPTYYSAYLKDGKITWKLMQVGSGSGSSSGEDNVFFADQGNEFIPKETMPDNFLVVDNEPTQYHWEGSAILSSLISAINTLEAEVIRLKNTLKDMSGGNISDASANESTYIYTTEAQPHPIIGVNWADSSGGTLIIDSSGYTVKTYDDGTQISYYTDKDTSNLVYDASILDRERYPYEYANAIDGSVDANDYKYSLRHFSFKYAISVEEMNKFKDKLIPYEPVLCLENNSLYVYNANKNRMIAISGGNNIPDSSKDNNNEEILKMAEILQALKDGSVQEITFSDINMDPSSGNTRKYSVSVAGGKLQINEILGEQLKPLDGNIWGTGNTAIPKLTTSDLESLTINEFYANDDPSYLENPEHNMKVPVSHNFVEIANLDQTHVIDLSNVNLQYYNEAEGKWHMLRLKGHINPGSTYLIRGAQVAPEHAPKTIIDVSTFDIEWYENGKLMAFNNTVGALYLSIDPSIYTESAAYLANTSMTNPAGGLGLDTPTVPNTYLDLVGWGGNATMKEVTSFTKTGDNIMIVRRNMLDRSKQSLPAFYDSTSKATKRTNAYSAKNKAKYLEAIDLSKTTLGNERDFRPRCVAENKNVYTTRSFFREKKPYCVTVTFGIDAATTRCFNWISTDNTDEYLFYRKKGSSDDWIIKESYKKGDNQDPILRTKTFYKEPVFYSYNETTSGDTTVYTLVTASASDTAEEKKKGLDSYATAEEVSSAGFTAGTVYKYTEPYKVDIPVYDRIYWETSGKTFVTTHKVIIKDNVTTDVKGKVTSLKNGISYYTDYTLTTPSETATEYTKGEEYEYCVGPALYDDYNMPTGPDSKHCSEIQYFQVRPAIIDKDWEFIQHTDQQGFVWQEYEVWRRSAKVIRAQFNPQFTINTGDMTQNGNRISEWIDYNNAADSLSSGKEFNAYLGAKKTDLNGGILYHNYSAGVEQMNVVGNNDESPLLDYLLGNGADPTSLTNTAGKISARIFTYFYCYEIDPEIAPINFIKENGIVTGVESIMPSCYSFNYNNCHFIGICSEMNYSSIYLEYNDSEENGFAKTNTLIEDWVQNDLNKWYKHSLRPASTAKYPWCIAFMHEMPFTILITSNAIGIGRTAGGSKVNDYAKYTYHMSELFQNNHVRLVIGGHKHTHSQTYPLFENVSYMFMDADGKDIIEKYSWDMTADELDYAYGNKVIPENYSVNDAKSEAKIVKSIIREAPKPGKPLVMLPKDIDPTILSAYKACSQSTSTTPIQGVTFPNRYQINGVCCQDNNGESFAPVYVMSQATGNKVVSNKEMPTASIPWFEWYYPTTVKDGKEAVDTNQKSPHFIKYTFKASKNADDEYAGKIEISHYQIYKKPSDFGWCDTMITSMLLEGAEGDERTDPLGRIAPLKSPINTTLTEKIAHTINYMKDFKADFTILKPDTVENSGTESNP